MTQKYAIEGSLRHVDFVELALASSLDEPDPVRVGVFPSDANTFWLRVGNRYEVITVVHENGTSWIWHKGRARKILPEEPRRSRASTRLPGAITPPMPATVVGILVKVGEEVKQGQPLIIVSAMKMETSLVSPHRGRVDAIHTEVGATVRPGDVLVDVKET